MAKLTNPNESDIVDKDSNESPRSNRETDELQSSDVEESVAVHDEQIEEDDVNVLPGTGGPDDVGDVDVDESDIRI